MIQFNPNGLLIPDTNIIISLEDFQHHFVNRISSQTRQSIFKKYVTYSNALKRTLKVTSLKQWIDGSFATNINNPRDIDLITFIDLSKKIEFEKELQNFEKEAALKKYDVDAYILTVIPQDHDNLFLYKSDKAYWMTLFSKTKRDNYGRKSPKGFLEIHF